MSDKLPHAAAAAAVKTVPWAARLERPGMVTLRNVIPEAIPAPTKPRGLCPGGFHPHTHPAPPPQPPLVAPGLQAWEDLPGKL